MGALEERRRGEVEARLVERICPLFVVGWAAVGKKVKKGQPEIRCLGQDCMWFTRGCAVADISDQAANIANELRKD